MRLRILGSAAGGGFPQWNCACVNCAGVRHGTIRAARRGEACAAVSGDGMRWVLLGCPAGVHGYIESFEPLQPRGPRAAPNRQTPIEAILLPNGDLDACLGLLTLRERQPLALYATDAVRAGFTEGNVLYRTLCLTPDQARWWTLRPGVDLPLPGGLVVTAVAAPGKPPVHWAERAADDPGQNVGFVIRHERGGWTLGYFPSVGRGPAAEVVLAALAGCDVVVFDGTLWSEDELAPISSAQELAQLAHWPLGGPGGSLSALAALPARVKRVTHVNNTNPILRVDSPERRELEQHGIRPAFDGEEIEP